MHSHCTSYSLYILHCILWYKQCSAKFYSMVISTCSYRWSIQVGDLQYASPATVSRCGMVYVDPKNLGYMPYWERWVNKLPSEGDKKEFCRLFDKYANPCISLILEGVMDGRQGEKLKTIIPVTNLNMVRHSVLRLGMYCWCYVLVCIGISA